MEGVRLIEVSLYLFVWDGLFSTEFDSKGLWSKFLSIPIACCCLFPIVALQRLVKKNKEKNNLESNKPFLGQ